MLIPCPHCGTRPVEEFTFLGDATVKRPTTNDPASMDQWFDYVYLRDNPRGMEVLMIRRAERPGDQNSGATVFPGGLLDASDRGHYERCNGLDDAAASARLGLPSDGLHYWVAAVRECFEEAGLLFATNADGHTVDLNALPADEVHHPRQVTAHLQQKDWDGQHEADPEAPGEVHQLRVGSRLGRGGLRFECHAADRATARPWLPDLRVHRAGVDGARRHRLCAQRRTRLQILSRFGDELGAATG